MTANGLGGGLYSNVIKSTGNSAVYTPSSSIRTEPLTDKYSVEDNIGRGKFAVVKKCISKDTGEEVAAKFIKKRRRGKSCREEILREVVMLEMALDHPRLVNLKEVYETSTELVLITEYCAGGELFTNCILEEKFNEADVRLLMSQILEGLVYLHDKNIVHLDLKPQNILLTHEFPRGSVKICDLGFACLVNTGEDIRDIIGTPDYVAPEVLNYDPLGLYTDMWSLGVLTYVMLTTCSPFAGDDKQETFCNITTVNLDFPSDLFENISTSAQDFIRKLLVAEPSERLTAAECMQHEWIVGASSPQKHINVEEIEENRSVLEDTKSELSYQSASMTNLNEEFIKSEQHEKVKDDVSEMSVTEEGEDSRLFSESFSSKNMDQDHSDINLHERNLVTNASKESNESEQLGSTGQSESTGSTSVNQGSNCDIRVLNQSTSVDIRELNNGIKLESVLTEDIQTPDSESSMCISDGRLDDDDSGVGTGTDTRAESETRTVSRNSITDAVIEKELDTDILEEWTTDRDHMGDTSEDQDMLSKSLIESEYRVISEGNKNTPGINESQSIQDGNTNAINDLNSENITDSTICDGQTEMEHSDIVASSSKIDAVVNKSNSIFNRYASSETAMNAGPNINTILNPVGQSIDPASPSSIRRLHISVTDVQSETILSNSTNAKSTETSIGGQQDSVGTVPTTPSSGEKRGICNLGTTQGAESSENQDDYEFVSVSKRVNQDDYEFVSVSKRENQDDYEFVSVSKRVKSYEETVTRIQQFSPKTQRSPRVGRHAKSHQHHS